MLFTTYALLALAALITPTYPHPQPSWMDRLGSPYPRRGLTYNIELNANQAISARADNAKCTNLDLPTESSYRLGYETFCNGFIPAESSLTIQAKALTGTVLIKNYHGHDVPWVFKVTSEIWAGASRPMPYILHRKICIKRFRDVLEGVNAKAGDNYCVVGDLGARLVMRGTVRDYPQGLRSNSNAMFETRRRKGEFDASKEKRV